MFFNYLGFKLKSFKNNNVILKSCGVLPEDQICSLYLKFSIRMMDAIIDVYRIDDADSNQE